MSNPQNPQSQQPWAQLYNLESQLRQQPLTLNRKVGRPNSAFPRSPKQLRLTADEKRLLATLTANLRGQFESDKITGSQVIGFALRLMEHTIKQRGGMGEAEEFASLWERLSQTSSE